jgi:outer membrane protein assembly factor BamB
MSTSIKWSLSLCCFTLALGAFAEDWPNFRGPKISNISPEKGLPLKWRDKENIVWKTKLPGWGGSSPITVGERIFVTCYSGYGTGKGGNQEKLQRHLVCIDRKKGEILWQKDIKAKLPETPYQGAYITKHGYASSTPASDGKQVYVFFGKSGLFAFDFEGNQVWQADAGTGTDSWGSGSSPILYKDLVIINASAESGLLLAFNKKSGDKVWQASGMKKSWTTPVLADVQDRQELVISVRGSLLGFDPDKGKQLWNCDGINDYVCSTVVAKDGIVYAIGGRQGRSLAVRAGGKGDVTATHVLWRQKVGSNVGSPVLYNEHLYWTHEQNGAVYCLKASSGDIVNQKRLSGSGLIYASVVVADGKLYIVSREEGTYVLSADPKLTQLAHNVISSDSSVFNGSPVFSNGRLLLRSNQYLYCIGKK